MDLLLKEKKILVTGASKGIGLACSKILASEGANLIISSRSAENLENARKKIGKHSGELYTFPADISRENDIDALADFADSKFGTPDGLLINTGGPPMGSTLSHPDEAWLEAFNSLLMAVVRITRIFVPAMQKQNYGRIVSISSTGVKQPIPGLVLSNSVRQAVVAYLKTLSAEVAANNVFINNILPGSTNTERLESLHRTMADNSGKSYDEIIEMRKKIVPAGKFAEPEHQASLAAFLLSEKNGYITGQSVAVDGGMVSFPL